MYKLQTIFQLCVRLWVTIKRLNNMLRTISNQNKKRFFTLKLKIRYFVVGYKISCLFDIYGNLYARQEKILRISIYMKCSYDAISSKVIFLMFKIAHGNIINLS